MTVSATPAPYTVKNMLEDANGSKLPQALAELHLGYKESGIKVTAPAAPTLPSHADPSATFVGSTIVLNPPAQIVKSCRVTAGTAATGTRIMSDSGATPGQIGTSGVYVATLSDDGTTITLEAAATGAVISYIPRVTAARLAESAHP